jgi:DNA-binding response OmpR family regulator
LKSEPDKDELPVNTLELKSILLVDNDQQLASALQWILADEDFLVDTAFDGEDALQKVKINEYDAVVCDLMMPRLRGDEFYFKALESRPNLSDRFIFITGFANDPKVNLFLIGNRVKYLVKPFPVEELITSVKELLGARFLSPGRLRHVEIASGLPEEVDGLIPLRAAAEDGAEDYVG